MAAATSKDAGGHPEISRPKTPWQATKMDRPDPAMQIRQMHSTAVGHENSQPASLQEFLALAALLYLVWTYAA